MLKSHALRLIYTKEWVSDNKTHWSGHFKCDHCGIWKSGQSYIEWETREATIMVNNG